MKAGYDVNGVRQWPEKQTVGKPAPTGPPHIVQDDRKSRRPTGYATYLNVDLVEESISQASGFAFVPVLGLDQFSPCRG
jgi:hypothetical protein